MGKKLSEMTLQELWELFPIQLTAHNDAWAGQYEEMRARLEGRLAPHHTVRISHIGSTAVKGIWAKPIVDILVEIAPGEHMDAVATEIEHCGFAKMAQTESRMSFQCGYEESGFAEKVYHLHLRHAGDCAELYFRDYLNENPHIAAEYEHLKLGLWHRYEHDRDAYTAAKTAFVTKHTAMAKELYGKRYEKWPY